MSNGKSRLMRVMVLAAAIASIGGCDQPGSTQQSQAESAQARAGQLLNAARMRDAARGRLWSLAQEGIYVQDDRTPGKRLVPLPGWLWAGSPYSCDPGLALGPGGEVIVTSDVLPTLWRIDPDTLAVSVHPLALDADADKDVGFSAIVYAAEQNAYLAVSETHGSLWRIDPLLRRAEKIARPAPARYGCGVAPGSPLTRKASDRFARNRAWLLSQIPLNGG